MHYKAHIDTYAEINFTFSQDKDAEKLSERNRAIILFFLKKNSVYQASKMWTLNQKY